MTKVFFDAPTAFEARGRHGYVKNTGLEITPLGDEVEFRVITSRGQTSPAIRLSVPLADVDTMIAAMLSMKRRVQLMAQPAAVTPADLQDLLPDDRSELARVMSELSRETRQALLADQDASVRAAARFRALMAIEESLSRTEYDAIAATLRIDPTGLVNDQPVAWLTPVQAAVAAVELRRRGVPLTAIETYPAAALVDYFDRLDPAAAAGDAPPAP